MVCPSRFPMGTLKNFLNIYGKFIAGSPVFQLAIQKLKDYADI
jgi:hypothetical protein